MAAGLVAFGQASAQGQAGASPQTAVPNKAPAGAQAPADAAAVAHGKQIFTDYSCGSCHALSDAGADGHVGPSLDGNAGLTKALVVDRVTHGQGPMPAFGGQLSDQEIADVAVYVTTAAKK